MKKGANFKLEFIHRGAAIALYQMVIEYDDGSKYDPIEELEDWEEQRNLPCEIGASLAEGVASDATRILDIIEDSEKVEIPLSQFIREEGMGDLLPIVCLPGREIRDDQVSRKRKKDFKDGLRGAHWDVVRTWVVYLAELRIMIIVGNVIKEDGSPIHSHEPSKQKLECCKELLRVLTSEENGVVLSDMKVSVPKEGLNLYD